MMSYGLGKATGSFVKKSESTEDDNKAQPPPIGMDIDEHRPLNRAGRCMVCRMEYNWKHELGQNGMASGCAECSKCGTSAHSSVVVDSNRIIHTLPQFRGMTCFEIMHSEDGRQMWPMVGGASSKFNVKLNTKHPLVAKLRMEHGLPELGMKKGNDDEDN